VKPAQMKKKTRVFFIMFLIRLLIDKISFGDIFPQFYGNGNIGIGHVWKDGGAERIARDIGAYDKLLSFFETDIAKMDQSLHPWLLTLLFSLPLSLYNPDGDEEEYKMLRAFMTWSADETAVKMVKWTGMDYRIVVGVMFSGLYGTSWGDSLYADVALRTLYYYVDDYLHYCLLKLSGVPARPVQGDTCQVPSWLTKEQAAQAIELWDEFIHKGKIYGDNILFSLPTLIMKIITNPLDPEENLPHYPFGFIQRFFSHRFGMRLKLEETHVFHGDEFWTTVTQVRDVSNPMICDTRVIHGGVKYLKRFFYPISCWRCSLCYALPTHSRLLY